METWFLNLISKFIKWVIYLILAGEITSCTIDMRKNAGKSLSTGLVSLNALNKQLMKKKE